MVRVLSGLNSTMAGLHSIHLSVTHTCGTLCGRLCDSQSHYRNVCVNFTGILGLVAVVRGSSVFFYGAYQVVGSTLESLAKKLSLPDSQTHSFYFFLFHGMRVCLNVSMYTICLSGAYGGQKWVSGSLEQ